MIIEQTENKCNPNDCPHPCGTYETCLKCKASGDNINYIYVTDGRKMTKWKTLDRVRAEMIKKEIDEYLWKIGFTNWIDASRAEVKNNIFNIIDSYYPK